MNHAKLLDCTLRDGAYLIDKKFGDATTQGIIKGLVDTGIEFIEFGFLQDDEFGEGKVIFKNGAEAEKFIPEKFFFRHPLNVARHPITNQKHV